MQKLIRKKKYKARSPMETVEIIREILKKSGIEIEEDARRDREVGVYSCRLSIANEGVSELDLGTNGKGMTKEYSLASGYAELMERLQNERLFVSEPKSRYNVSAVPVCDCRDDVKAFLKANFVENEKAFRTILSLYDEFCMADFTTFDESETVSVPYDILLAFSTSNGMCAGNNRTEAVLQGTSEIFERYAQQKIIFEKLCPPVIPDEYFEGHEIYDKIQLLRKNNIYCEIKDCSLGIGLPVIGLYLRNSEGREFFHLGSDPSPVTALERTVTEIFQGVDEIREVSFYDPVTGEHDEDFWKYQLTLSACGGNVNPSEISGNSYSWEFKGFDHPESVSDEDDMNYYLDIVRSLGRKLYIRDVSFTGFPSYYCYIPGLNHVNFCSGNAQELAGYLKLRRDIRNLVSSGELGKRDRRKLSNLLTSYKEEFWYMSFGIVDNVFFPKGLFRFGFGIPLYIESRLHAGCGRNSLSAELMEDYIISGRLSRKTEEKLTDFVMYMRTGEHELEETPSLCSWTFGDSIGCRSCEKCCVRSYCCREAADSLFGGLYKQQ